MAFFRFDVQAVKRSRGQQATGTAAYCAGEKIRDERTGKVHNHSRRQDVRHTEILLPSRFGNEPMEWARNRTSLWNAAEAAEKRKNSRVAREYQLSLPAELNPEQRLALARTFAREVADGYGVAVDLAIHDPKPDRDTPNFHAHLLTTTREVTPTGFGAKTGLDLGIVPRATQGLAPHGEEIATLRERWATLTNEALQAANIATRVDHRSLAAQGIARPAVLHIPMEFYRLERQGMPKEQAERLRSEYRARVAAYRERSAGAWRTEDATAQPAASGERVTAGASRTEDATAQPAAPGERVTAGASRTEGAVAQPAVPDGRVTAGASRTEDATAQPAGPGGRITAGASRAEHATQSAVPGGRTTSYAAAPREGSALQPGPVAPRTAEVSATANSVASPRAGAKETAPPSLQKIAEPGLKQPVPLPARELIPRNPEETRRRAVQAWLEMRSKEAESSQSRGQANEVAIKRGREEGQER
jgi:hypothetical protein